MPVTAAMSTDGACAHNAGPKEWWEKVGKISVVVA
jgi:hypothetical protein